MIQKTASIATKIKPSISPPENQDLKDPSPPTSPATPHQTAGAGVLAP